MVGIFNTPPLQEHYIYMKNPGLILLAVLLPCGLTFANLQDSRAPSLPASRGVSFDITYTLTPRSPGAGASLITLLPRTIADRQTVQDISYSRQPDSVFKKNGNLYAQFDIVNASDPVEIVISVDAQLHPHDLETAMNLGPGHSEPGENLHMYLRHERKIETNSSELRKAADRISGDNEIDIMRSALGVVLSRLSYSGFQSQELGALGAWRFGRGDCTEYSDLLIALLRARGIPARAISGLITNFSDVPHHNWVEVYTTDYGWVPLDPLHVALRSATFERLRPIYIYLSNIRNDSILNGWAIWSCRMIGKGMDVDPSLRITSGA